MLLSPRDFVSQNVDSKSEIQSLLYIYEAVVAMIVW